MNHPKEKDAIAVTEHRIRRYLNKWGRGRESNIYHQTCAPHYSVTREQFSALIQKLSEQGVVQRLDGVHAHTVWIVRSDLVDETYRMITEQPDRKPLTPESC